MTSRPVLDAVLAELRFGARGAASGATGRFAFATDFDAPERWPDVPYDTSSASARHDTDARTRIASILDGAARTMDGRAPAARRLVDAQLQRVLLRCSETAPGGSASHRSHVGSCLMTNLHRSAAAVPVAIEAVTHEAIHQLLYRTEQATGLFCDLSPLPTVRSPWSGARLPLHSLVHASFVWFGLLSLWSELALAPSSDADAEHARARIAHCLFGFAFLDDLLDAPSFPASGVEPRVLDAMHGMAAAARTATDAAEPGASLGEVAAARLGPAWPSALAARLP